MELPFVKMHGLGNDFIVIDTRHVTLDFETRLAAKLCDRNFGIGADGVLLWSGTRFEPIMTVVNSDGSVAEMCGNGLRCFVKYLADRYEVYGDAMIVTTGAGALTCEMIRHQGGRVAEVAVAMGTPTFLPGLVPAASQAPVIDKEIKAGGRYVRVTAVGTGNPHCVVFDELVLSERQIIAADIANHELFPKGANVEFCELLPKTANAQVEMRCDVYERGCGWTLACGTGATAAVTAALKLGRVTPEEALEGVRVKLPGGWLTITIDARGAATMTGPATEVFQGTVDVMPRRS